MPTYFLGLGSNLDPARNTEAMLEALLDFAPTLTVSRVIETEPVGMNTQHCFFNAVVALEYGKNAADFKAELNQLEARLGRNRADPNKKNQDRPADVDIICALEPGETPTPGHLPPEAFLQPLLLELWAFLNLPLPCPAMDLAEGVVLQVKGQVVGVAPRVVSGHS